MVDPTPDRDALPGAVVGPDGELIGPASATNSPDPGPAVSQHLGYEQAVSLDPDLSLADPAVQATS